MIMNNRAIFTSQEQRSLQKYYEELYIVFNKEGKSYVWWEIGKFGNQQKKKEKESKKILRFWVRLFDGYFLLKSQM